MPIGRLRPQDLFLIFTATVTGALVMVVEVLGARVLGPYFGVSLFVWTALIAVTLLSLSVGYAVGGWFADHRPDPAWLYAFIFAAGVLVALVPLIKSPVVLAVSGLGLRGGAMSAAAILFGPALMLLGMASPFVLRLLSPDGAHLGRIAGALFALSTAGSFAGTVFAGYVMIGWLGVSRSMLVSGVLLMLVGVSYFAVFRRRPGWLAVPLVFLLVPSPGLPALTLGNGTRAEVVAAVDSYYGAVRVVDYRYGSRHHREMLIDGLLQSGIDMADGRSVYEYPYLLERLPLAAKPGLQHVLVIGVGGGVVPKALERRGIAVDTVDIDPLVVDVAVRHFGAQLATPTWFGDGRRFLVESRKRYDAVVMDVFSGEVTPGHLLTVEAVRAMKARLAPDGVLALNLIGGERSQAMRAILRTLSAEFSSLRVFPLDVAATPDAGGAGNMVLLARNGPLDAPAGDVILDGVHPFAERSLRDALARTYVPAGYADAPLLTDESSTLELMDLDLHEDLRREIIRNTPAAILLSG